MYNQHTYKKYNFLFTTIKPQGSPNYSQVYRLCFNYP